MDIRQQLLYNQFMNESSRFVYNFVKENNKTLLNDTNEKYYMEFLKSIQNKIFNEKFRESMLYNIEDSLIFLNKLTINEFDALIKKNSVVVSKTGSKKETLFLSIHQLLNESTNNYIILDYNLSDDDLIVLPDNTQKICLNSIDIEIHIINSSNNSFQINSNTYTMLPGNYTITDLVEYLNQMIELDGKIIYNHYINRVGFVFNKLSNIKLNASLAKLLGFNNIEYTNITKIISEKNNAIDVYQNGYIKITINDTKLDIYHTNSNLEWFSVKYPKNITNKKHFDTTNLQKNRIDISVYNKNLELIPREFYNINLTFIVYYH